MPILTGVPVGTLVGDVAPWAGGGLDEVVAVVLALPPHAARLAAIAAAAAMVTARAALRVATPNAIAPLLDSRTAG
jgi:hypothetical protein